MKDNSPSRASAVRGSAARGSTVPGSTVPGSTVPMSAVPASASTFSWIFRRAIAASILLTAVMALCGTVANLARPLSWLAYVSRAIAFPPSLIVRHLVTANGGSMAAVIATEFEGAAFSLIFYALLAGGILWLVSRRMNQ